MPNNEIAAYTAPQGLTVEQSLASNINAYTSMKAETPQEKQVLFNAMNNPSRRLKSAVNTVINVRDVYVETVECTNRDTGEVTPCHRIVLICTDGESYQCVSQGVFSALQKLFLVFGTPTWTDGLPLRVKTIDKGDRSMLTLEAAF